MKTLKEYAEFTKTTAQYPNEKALEYLTLGLCGEAGEIANKLKKILRGDKDAFKYIDEIEAELGDCLWYVARLSWHIGSCLERVATLNANKLSKRVLEGTIKGAGDNR